MDLIDRLCREARILQGEGVNHEEERFHAELRVEPLVDGRAVMLRYRATLEDGSLVHEECTLLGAGRSGALTLWPVMAELPVVIPHEHRPALAPTPEAFVFSSGDREDETAFREEITIGQNPDLRPRLGPAWRGFRPALFSLSSARLRRGLAAPACLKASAWF
jgi:hypothetical protein